MKGPSDQAVEAASQAHMQATRSGSKDRVEAAVEAAYEIILDDIVAHLRVRSRRYAGGEASAVAVIEKERREGRL